MKHLPFTVAIVAIVILAGMPAVSAAETVVQVPSQNQILACQEDARRLCGAYLLGPIEVVRACMLAHKAQLNQPCREAIK